MSTRNRSRRPSRQSLALDFMFNRPMSLLCITLLFLLLLIQHSSFSLADETQTLPKHIQDNVDDCDFFHRGNNYPVVVYNGLVYSCSWPETRAPTLPYVASTPGLRKPVCEDINEENAFLQELFPEENISLLYLATQEVIHPLKGGFSRTVAGKVNVHYYENCEGFMREQHKFVYRENWEDPLAKMLWPARIWSKDINKYNYELQIDGLGEFTAQKRNGVWGWTSELYKEPFTKENGKWEDE